MVKKRQFWVVIVNKNRQFWVVINVVKKSSFDSLLVWLKRADLGGY